MNFVVRCRGCGGGKAVLHRANLCAECQVKAGAELIDAYIAAAMTLKSARFVEGEYEAASKALREALDA